MEETSGGKKWRTSIAARAAQQKKEQNDEKNQQSPFLSGSCMTQPADHVERLPKRSRVGWGRVGRRFKYDGTGRVGSGQEVFKSHRTGRVVYTLTRPDP